MKIVVKKHVPLVFYIPNCLLHSRPVAAIIVSAMQKEGIAIDRAKLTPLLRQCSAIFRQRRGLTFVEVHAKDGTYVKITL